MRRSALADLLKRKTLLIFDLDGTLADSSPIHARAFREAFAPLGIVPDYSTVAGLTTEAGVDRLLGEAGIELGAEERSALIADKRARAMALIDAGVGQIEGAVEFVRRAAPYYGLALCTSGSRPAVEKTVEILGLSGMFEPLVAGGDVVRGKPDPEGFDYILVVTKTRPGDALVFEDADSGLQAAARAGIDTVRIDDGARRSDAHRWATLINALGEIGR